jgi:HEAT repeat protein
MKRRNWVVLVCVLTIVALLGIVPTWRAIVVGLARGERTYRMKPTSYWTLTLTERDPDSTKRALDLLLKGGVRSIPVLIEALASDDAYVRLSAATTLGSMGTTSVPALAKALEDPNAVVRIGAARALQRVGPDAVEAMPALHSALWDTEPLVIEMAVTAIGCIGKQTVPVLITVVESHREIPARRAALNALARMGADASDAVPALLKAIHDDNERISEPAEEALKAIDPQAAEKAGVL